MFLRPLKRLRKTVGFRLTLWYSTLFILSSLLLFTLAYLLLSSSLNKQDKVAIESKVIELSVLYQSEGIESLRREVSIERKFEKESSYFVRLAGQENKTLFLMLPYQWAEFDIKKLEKMAPKEGTVWTRLPSKINKSVLEIASVQLTDGYLLQAGKSTRDREKVLKHFRETFVAAVIPLILFGLAGGTFLGFRALQPIRQLIETIRSVSTGRMDARVPSPQTADELEALVKLFNAMLEKIETLIRAMKGSLDNIAHDMRTPMTRLRVSAERALQSGQKAEACEQALADCIMESEQILKMLDTLMDISEAETGVMKLNREVVDLRALMGKVVDMYSYVAEENGIRIHLSAPDGLCITADRARISQVLANMLDNAIKYTPRGGLIDLEAHGEGSQVVIIVRDSGIGISREELPKIWGRLYRGDQSQAQRGLGLGLSLVKAIVGAHKGRVHVFSEPGKGSAFTICLPLVS